MSFSFAFDYKNFDGKGKTEMAKTKWTVFSKDKRIVYFPKNKSYSDVFPTDELKQTFEQAEIKIHDDENLLDVIMEIGAVVDDTVYEADVLIKFHIKPEQLDKLNKQLADATSGEIQAISDSEKYFMTQIEK